MLETISGKEPVMITPEEIQRNDAYSRHLIAHELVHVLQYERFGGIEPYLKAYVPEIVSPPYYPNGPLEQEARRVADAVCADLS